MKIIQKLVYSKRYSISAAECNYYVPVCRFRKAFCDYSVRDPLQYEFRQDTDAKAFLDHGHDRIVIGAATVYSALLDPEWMIQVVFDKDVADSEWYGCSDGTTTGYMKVRTQDILKKYLPYTKHDYRIVAV